MLHSQTHLERGIPEQSFFTPWQNLEEDIEDDHFLTPISSYLSASLPEWSDKSSSEQETWRWEDSESKAHSTTWRTIGSPPTLDQRETAYKQSNKTWRNSKTSSSIRSDFQKRRLQRKTSSLNTPQQRLLLTNNVVCFKTRSNLDNISTSTTQKNVTGCQKSNPKTILFDEVVRERRKVVQLNWTNPGREEKRNENCMKQCNGRDLHFSAKKGDGFTVRRNDLRIGRSKKVVQLI